MAVEHAAIDTETVLTAAFPGIAQGSYTSTTSRVVTYRDRPEMYVHPCGER